MRDEPVNVASAIHALELSYVVITSVDRDDLPDFGASHFARTIRETRARIPQCRLEVLIPDFQGDEAALRIVLDAGPDVLNHNIETVPRLYRTARPGGRYPRALERASSIARHRAGDPDQVGTDGRSRRRMGRGRRDAARISGPPAARSSRSASISGRRSRTCRWSATTRRRSSPS